MGIDRDLNLCKVEMGLCVRFALVLLSSVRLTDFVISVNDLHYLTHISYKWVNVICHVLSSVRLSCVTEAFASDIVRSVFNQFLSHLPYLKVIGTMSLYSWLVLFWMTLTFIHRRRVLR